MAKISTPPLFFIGSTPTIALNLPRGTAVILATVAAWRTRSTLLTIVLGMSAFWMLQALSSESTQHPGKLPTMMTEEQIEEAHHTLNELHIEHRDLDLVIEHLLVSPPADDLLIRRLKKRKLLLKDRITQLEHLLEPNVLA